MKNRPKYILKGSPAWCIRALLIILVLQGLTIEGCKKLPQNTEEATNPLDPANPSKTVNRSTLALSPQRIITKGDTFTVELWLATSDSIFALSTSIHYNPQVFSVVHAKIINDFLLQNGGQLVEFIKNDSSKGDLKFDLVVVESKPHDIAGMGKMVEIMLAPLNQVEESSITIRRDSELLNSKNETVTIKEFIDATVSW